MLWAAVVPRAANSEIRHKKGFIIGVLTLDIV